MFSKPDPEIKELKAKKKKLKDCVPSIISSDLKILGNMISEGIVEIEGDIEGNIDCLSATIRKTGSVKGDIAADTIIIEGEVSGLIKGSNITVSETGRVNGIIMYESLSIKDGAFVDGQCKSTENLKTADVEKINFNQNIDSSSEKIFENLTQQ